SRLASSCCWTCSCRRDAIRRRRWTSSRGSSARASPEVAGSTAGKERRAMSTFRGFRPEALRFLRGLKKNNRRDWLEGRRWAYLRELVEPMKALVEELDVRFADLAPEFVGDPKHSIFRIYRDVRFSRDKSPYKAHAALWIYS